VSAAIGGPDLVQVRLATPEHVELPFTIAPAAVRLSAFLVDLGVLFAALVVLATVYAIAGPSGEGYLTAIVLLALFLGRNFYFSFSELRWHGQTIGKRRAGIRVIARDGGPLTAEMVFARNLTRDLEIFLPLTVLFAPDLLFAGAPGWARLAGSVWLAVVMLLPLFNRHRARVGDLVAGTIVVLAPRGELLPDLVRERPQEASGKKKRAEYTFTQEQLDVYGIKELQVLEDVLRQDPLRRSPDLVDTICEKIKRKIGWPKARWHVEPEAFLHAFYEAQRARLEHKMLLGKRQEQKIR
jgi:uncharacterized RDD family membrane protein YckC